MDRTDAGLRPPPLPLGVSFITFQQIAYLVEQSRDREVPTSALDYALFIGFFPKLVAGPLADPTRLLPQLRALPPGLRSADLGVGLTLLAAGLFKKVLIADELGECADPIFATAGAGVPLDAATAWLGALAYTLQIYFDFAGYSDMALGAARCFGIRLPLNFDSPYQATQIGDFWRRWHMTLTRFLTQYLYTPLATPLTRRALARSLGPTAQLALTVAVPTIATFTLAGLWHGAGWTFVIFGLLHGLYLTLSQAWRELRRAWLGRPVPSRWRSLGSWALTFGAVIVAFVFFRSDSVASALSILAAMAGAPSPSPVDLGLIERRDLLLVLATAAIALLAPSSAQVLRPYSPAQDTPRGGSWLGSHLTYQPRLPYALACAAIWILALARLGEVTDFIYYRF